MIALKTQSNGKIQSETGKRISYHLDGILA